MENTTGIALKRTANALAWVIGGFLLSSCTMLPPQAPAPLKPAQTPKAASALAQSMATMAAALPPASTYSVILAWDPSASPDVAGYVLYYGNASRGYTNRTQLPVVTTATVSNLTYGPTYYYSVTSVDVAGLESDYSAEVSYAKSLPAPSTNLLVSVSALQSTDASGGWIPLTNWPAITLTNPPANLFLRLAITNWVQ